MGRNRTAGPIMGETNEKYGGKKKLPDLEFGKYTMGSQGRNFVRGSSAAAEGMPKVKRVIPAKQSPVGPMGSGPQQRRGSAKAAPPKAAKLAAPAVSTPAPAPAKKNDDYFNRRAELGSFYLNATSGMFSPKAGGKKKK